MKPPPLFIPHTEQAYKLPAKNIFNKYIRFPYCPLTNFFGTQAYKESRDKKTNHADKVNDKN